MMMRTVLGALAITTLASHSASAASTQETVLAPLSDWKVEAGNNACKLQRSFGTEDDSLFLQVASYGSGTNVEFLLRGNEIGTSPTPSDVWIDYGVAKPVKAGRPIAPKTDDGAATLVFNGPVGLPQINSRSAQPSIDMAMLDQATPIAFLSDTQRLTLQSSNLRYALDELKKCNDALVASWGFDVAEQAHLIRRTDPKDGLALAKRLNAQYPASQLRFARDAHVNVVLFVDADGKAMRCIVPQSYNPPVFDTIACKTVMAAPFEPALNQEGKPVASFFSSTIYFFAP